MIRLLTTLTVLLATTAVAQVPMTGAGLPKPTAVASYSGPGDVVSTAAAFWGLRAYNGAYAAALSKLANICAPLDAMCADVSSDVNGNFNLSAVGTLACNNTVSICTVKTLYDQSGALACAAGTACDVTQVTIANRPTLVVPGAANGCPSTAGYCMAFALASVQCLFTATSFTLAQPFSYHSVGIRTGNVTTLQNMLAFTSAAQLLGFSNAANTVRVAAGSAVTAAGNDSVWHNIDAVINNTSGALAVDGASTAGTVGASAPSAVVIEFGARSTACIQSLDGKMIEGGIWPVAFSGANLTALNSNAHTYWGF